jgi:hypothetical protein
MRIFAFRIGCCGTGTLACARSRGDPLAINGGALLRQGECLRSRSVRLGLLHDHLCRSAIRRWIRTARYIRRIRNVGLCRSAQRNRPGPRPSARFYIPTATLGERVVVRFEVHRTGLRRGIHPKNPLILRFNKRAVGFLTAGDVHRAFRRPHRGRGSRTCRSRRRRAERKRQSEANYRNQGRMNAASLFHHKLSSLDLTVRDREW